MIQDKGKINIALSGGNTPKLFFKALAENYKNIIDWSKVNLFWVDERCVPAESEESNFGMTKRYLIDKVSIPEDNVHGVFGNDNPFLEVIRYTEILKKYISQRNGFPEFDLILLGVGDDGHTASIFPDQMELLISNEICSVATHPGSGQKRITLTGKTINTTDRIYFLVTGKSKSEVVSKIIGKRDDYLKYPASHIKPKNSEMKWYLDKDAAENVSA